MSTTTATKVLKGHLSHANEVFAQCLARGYTQTDAYKEAYPKSRLWVAASVTNKASALAKVAEIQARVQAIHSPAIRQIQENAAGYGLQQAMGEAQRAYDLAERVNQPGAMVAAVQLRAKLNALLIDRKEVMITKMDGMSPTEKMVLMQAAEEQLAIIKLGMPPEQPIDDVEPK